MMVPKRPLLYPRNVARILLVGDSPLVREEISAVLDPAADEVFELDDGHKVAQSVADHHPDLVVLDFQVASMGAMAISFDLRLEESAGRLPQVPVLMLLDRRADVFLARRSAADGYVVKPLDPMRLKRAIGTVLAGGRFEDPSYRPDPVLARSDQPGNPILGSGKDGEGDPDSKGIVSLETGS